MNAQQYNLLEIGPKADLLWPDGTFPDHRVDNDHAMVVIYKLYDLFVEVHFDVSSKDITKINALDTEEDMEGYLNSVSLIKLLQ